MINTITVTDKNSYHYEEVLQFWFGGDQQINYKMKWFPTNEKRDSLTKSHQELIDIEIYNKYKLLFLMAVNGELDDWKCLNFRSCLALIIFEGLPSDAMERSKADNIALSVSNDLHSSNIPTISNILLTPMSEFVFSLMPLRHTPTTSNLNFVLRRLEEKKSADSFSDNLLERFRKQTVRRLQQLEDREKLEATEDILEKPYLRTDETGIMSNSLVKTTEMFLKKHFQSITRDPITLIISLSGGVDSMVISKILRLLQLHSNSLKIQKVVSLHIDYANRPESGRESDYVKFWCEEIGTDCRVRTISEVTRGITQRDEYEKVARDIRYGFYKQCIKEVEEESGTKYCGGVIFGHHQGDVQENVVSNVMRGCSSLELSGMTEVSMTSGVAVWRPLLIHSKQEIYDFAHRFGIPYFKDSTPSWSTRGKLRNQLIPLLVSIYGKGCLNNLSQLAAESDEVRELVDRKIYKPFFESPCGLVVNITAYLSEPVSFWKEVFKKLLHSMSMSLVRDASVKNITERFTKGKPVIGWLELRKGYHTHLSASGDLVIVRDGVLRDTFEPYNPATTLNQLKQRRGKEFITISDSLDIPSSMNNNLTVVVSFNGNEQQLSLASVLVDSARLISFNTLHFPIAASKTEKEEYLTDNCVKIGPWLIQFALSSQQLPLNNNNIMTKAEDILDGEFSYFINISSDAPITLSVFWEVLKSAGNDTFDPLQISLDIKLSELRFREGLPLLVPVINKTNNKNSDRKDKLFLHYSYQ